MRGVVALKVWGCGTSSSCTHIMSGIRSVDAEHDQRTMGESFLLLPFLLFTDGVSFGMSVLQSRSHGRIVEGRLGEVGVLLNGIADTDEQLTTSIRIPGPNGTAISLASS